MRHLTPFFPDFENWAWGVERQWHYPAAIKYCGSKWVIASNQFDTIYGNRCKLLPGVIDKVRNRRVSSCRDIRGGSDSETPK
tara:strand:- start:3464 stop:3709 length:246 start_codon:yes stop_codon:yes gene_type:complete